MLAGSALGLNALVLGLLVAGLVAGPGALLQGDLALTQMPDGKVLAEFTFRRTVRTSKHGEAHHYALLPRSIGEVFHNFDVRELHLTFTQGRWSYDRWGHSDLTAPSGVELWTWFNSTDVDAKWKGLTNALAGLFCASLNFLDQTVTSVPLLSFAPEGSHPPFNRSTASASSAGASHGQSTFQIRYGSLPREAVCTENLTPWAKLLPCQTKSGLASLLNAYRVFDGNFQSIGVHLQPICINDDCSDTASEYTQTVAVVLDPIRTTSTKGIPLELTSLFDRQATRSCPFASSTTVQVNIPAPPSAVQVYPTPDTDSSTDTLVSHTYNVGESLFNTQVTWIDHSLDNRNHRVSPIRTHRYMSGVGQEHGGIVIDFHNGLDEAVPATYYESIPWILKLYLHTLKLETTASIGSSADIIQSTFYQPAMDRVRPNVLELSLLLPPKSKTSISIDFDTAFIKYTEHHPDANHGFELGVGVLTANFQKGNAGITNGRRPRIYTESLLVRLPTPDFSMPYNVITLTCTLFALFFGSVFNSLVRQFRPVRVARPPSTRWAFLSWLRRSKSTTTTTSASVVTTSVELQARDATDEDAAGSTSQTSTRQTTVVQSSDAAAGSSTSVIKTTTTTTTTTTVRKVRAVDPSS
ncbi:GPI transamidase component PIG-T [Entophlyctis helioformis]|nr:GPI transamidase component PIG-T [Entophlyctis helioformis]